MVACHVPPSMEFSRQECWSGLPFPSPGDRPNPGIKPGSPVLQADSLPSELLGKASWEDWVPHKVFSGLPVVKNGSVVKNLPANAGEEGSILGFLLQGISLTQESNLGLLHCRQILYCFGPLRQISSPLCDPSSSLGKWSKDCTYFLGMCSGWTYVFEIIVYAVNM